ncbi:MAG: tetratricopeptide repeat protein [Deltaproteobacteria bacterium]|nr:tetratricopeptide repeat protein [Deltaproteobacteria bacterium]
MSDFLTPVTADSLFVNALQQQASLEQLAGNALNAGITAYQKGDYKKAIIAFRNAIGLAPQSANAVDTAHYVASSYLKMGDSYNAAKAYEQAISLDPSRDDTHVKLGNLYYSQEKFQEAETQYFKAAKLNPDPVNFYSLGQAYIKTGRYNDAEDQFAKIQRLAPKAVNGPYGMGLNFSAQGRYDEAVAKFQEAISLDDEFYDAYVEMGYAYADMGEMDLAQEVFDKLEEPRPDLADTLSRYMYKVDKPKFAFAHADVTFPYMQPPRTKVASLDTYLETPGASKTFKMVFQFDKEMDRESVEDRFNWKISRSTASGPGEFYNFGMSVPETEIKLPATPEYVYYDANQLTATVYFKITQNATADGTLDPSHIVFKFQGEDTYGQKMDPNADEFSGFSRVG